MNSHLTKNIIHEKRSLNDFICTNNLGQKRKLHQIEFFSCEICNKRRSESSLNLKGDDHRNFTQISHQFSIEHSQATPQKKVSRLLCSFRLRNFENSEPEKTQFHTPSHSVPPLDSLLVDFVSVAKLEVEMSRRLERWQESAQNVQILCLM